MHNPNYTVNSTLNNNGNNIGNLKIDIRYTPTQTNSFTAQSTEERKVCELISEKIKQKEFFYGIEISAHSFGHRKTVLDYNDFGAFLPLFTSLIWFGSDYSQVDQISNVDAIRTAQALRPHTHVLPHFTAYRVNRDRLSQFLKLDFRNVLALRGDQVDTAQEFKYAGQMIAKMRDLRGDNISIGAAGYPEGHTDSNTLDDDVEHLSQKVKAGADYIITQVCFSAEAIISFVRRCREKGITVPVVMGLFVPQNFRILQRMVEITGAHLTTEQLETYQALSDDNTKFSEFAVNSATNMIMQVLGSDLDVYGVQFFTINHFKNVVKVLKKVTDKISTNQT